MFVLLLSEPETQNWILPYCEQYGDLLYRVALSLLKKPHDAEDAVQDVFLSLLKCREAVERVAPEKQRGYLITAVKNRCYLLLKKERAEQSPLPFDDSLAALAGNFDVEAIVQQREAAAMLERSLSRLPGPQRDILLLRHHYQMRGEEIAALLGLRVEAVYMRLSRATRALAELVRKELAENDGNQ